MLSGFYAIYYTGATGSGIGVIVITNTGVITGADMIGGRYDGNYTQNPAGGYDAKIRMSFPPGAALVTGALAGAQCSCDGVNGK